MHICTLWPSSGYEITGLENIPPEGKGALVVFYHGVYPFDVLYAASAVYNHCGRIIQGTAHKAMFSVPIIGHMLTVRMNSGDLCTP